MNEFSYKSTINVFLRISSYLTLHSARQKIKTLVCFTQNQEHQGYLIQTESVDTYVEFIEFIIFRDKNK